MDNQSTAEVPPKMPDVYEAVLSEQLLKAARSLGDLALQEVKFNQTKIDCLPDQFCFSTSCGPRCHLRATLEDDDPEHPDSICLGCLPRRDTIKASANMNQKDCTNCRRRRIKCDRTTPKCFKCGTRSLECPGYGKEYRWKPSNIAPSSTLFASRPKQNQIHYSSSSPTTTVSSLPSNPFSSSSLLLLQSPNSLPYYLTEPTFRRLLCHYVMVIAPQLDWIDTSQNIYRNDIPLISLEIPSVRWALLALAAGDLGSMLTSNSIEPRPDYLSMQDKLQDEALGPLTAHIYQLTHNPQPYGSLSVDQLRGLLVSMFLLVSLGIRTGRGPIWRLHMRAAYAISHAWLAADDTHLEDDGGIERSIIALLSEFQTWSSITAIDRPPSWNLRISCNVAEGPFHKYVGIIRHITELARDQRFTSNQCLSAAELRCLRVDIEEARRIATVQIQNIDFQSRQARQSFSSMIDIYYQSALIYFFRMKGDDLTDQASCAIARNQLFGALRGVSDMEPIAHCLAWPLLIAGTECHDCIDDQIFIEQKMLEVIKMTGGLDRARMMGLLREMWATSQQQTVVTWITMAKQWDRIGDPILIQ